MSASAPPRTLDRRSHAKQKRPVAPPPKPGPYLPEKLPSLTPEQMAAVPTLKTAYSKSGGSYYSPSGVFCTGLPENIVFKNAKGRALEDKVFKGQKEGTHCVGFTFWVFMKTAEERGLLKNMTPGQIRELQKLWSGKTSAPVLDKDGKPVYEQAIGKDGAPVMIDKVEKDPRTGKMKPVIDPATGKPQQVPKTRVQMETKINDYFWQQSTLVMETSGLGRRISDPKDAQPGDFVQLWREKNNKESDPAKHWAGHSVVFLGWVTNDKGERIGMKYRTSNQQGNLGPDGKITTKTVDQKDKAGKTTQREVPADGIGDRVEYFKGAKDAAGHQLMAPGQSLPVDPGKLYIGRMH